MNKYKLASKNSVNLDLDHTLKQQEHPNTSGDDNTAVKTFEKKINDFFDTNKRRFMSGRNLVLLLLYLGYYGYAMYCNFGDEESIRLTVFTGFGLAYLSWAKLKKWGRFERSWKSFWRHFHVIYSEGRRPTIIRRSLYIVWTVLFVVYIIINVAMKDAKNLRPLGGMAVYILILFIFSNNRRRINWHCVFYGTILQCLFGLLVIKTSAGETVLLWFSDRLSELLAYADVGSTFVFGDKYVDHAFAMQTIPSIIMFVAIVSVLIYLGAIQFIVRLLGTPLAFILDVSAPEAINAVANIFLGGAESSATVLEYLLKMPASRLFCICVGGFASSAGSALIQYRSFGVPLKYLLAASAMSAPAALVCSKIVYPDVDEGDLEDTDDDITLVSADGSKLMMPLTPQHMSEKTSVSKTDHETVLDDKLLESRDLTSDENDKSNEIFPKPKNVGEALVVGTKNGMRLAASIIGLLIVSLAVIELLNKTVAWFGDRVNINITLNKMISYLFYPFVYIMGVDTADCLRAGEFLGLRTLTSPGVPYIYLGQLIRNREIVANYTAFVGTFNQTFTYDRTDDIVLPEWNITLPGGFISERSELIVTYALCGYASLSTIGVTFGLITSFIPQRLPDITAVPVRLLVAGTIASYLTACVAGVLT